MKKIFIATIAIFILSQISCQQDCSKFSYWNFNGIQNAYLSSSSSQTTEYTDSVYTESQLTIVCLLGMELIAQSNFSFSNPFARTATAQYTGISGGANKCPPNGSQGVKDPIANLTITSSEDFNNIPAGVSLNSIVKPNNGQSVSEWLDNQLYNHPLSYHNDIPASGVYHFFTIMAAPQTNFTHSFTITYEMASGTIYSYTTRPIIWQH